MQIEYKALTRSSSCFLVVGKPVSVQRLPVSCAVARIELLCALTGTQSLVHCLSVCVCMCVSTSFNAYTAQGCGKTTLARKLSSTWHSQLVDGEYVLKGTV